MKIRNKISEHIESEMGSDAMLSEKKDEFDSRACGGASSECGELHKDAHRHNECCHDKHIKAHDNCSHVHGNDCDCGTALELNCCDGHGHSHGHDGEDDKHNKWLLPIRMGVTVLLMIAGALTNAFAGAVGEYIALGIYLAAYFVIAYDVLLRTVKNIMKGQIFDENFLMAIASIAAFAIKEGLEAVLVILLYQIGEAFQNYAGDKSVKSIKSIISIRPDKANLMIDGVITEVKAVDVKPGDTVIVLNGEKIPLDGTIIDGNSYVDTYALTGESVPRSVMAGDEVLAGFINNGGALKIEVSKEFANTAASKIIATVSEINSKKGKSERFVSKFAKIYTPIVVTAAFLIGLIPSLVTGNYVYWIETAITFLVISCPCALVISVPMTYFGGIGIASKSGILIKGGTYIDNLSRVKNVVMDKTGTLTQGNFAVSSIETFGFDKDELIKIAASVEAFSAHPIAKAICEYNDNESGAVSFVKEEAGMGLSAEYEGKRVLLGNAKLMNENGIRACEAEGTVVHAAIDNIYAGYIVISDTPKDSAAVAVSAMKEMKLSTFMLTGDKKEVAERVADELGIDRVYSELLPVQKTEMLDNIINGCGEKDKRKTVFVGDGINDAPVLAKADVGIAMGGLGSDAAIEASDVVIMNDDPMQVVKAIKISKKTRKIVFENIVFSLFVKLLIMALGLAGFANIWLAIFADVGVSILAVLNALRMLISSENKNRNK